MQLRLAEPIDRQAPRRSRSRTRLGPAPGCPRPRAALSSSLRPARPQVLIGGPMVSLGYVDQRRAADRREEHAARALDGISYFCTGDIGRDHRRRRDLRIDRKKDLVKLQQGESLRLSKAARVEELSSASSPPPRWRRGRVEDVVLSRSSPAAAPRCGGELEESLDKAALSLARAREGRVRLRRQGGDVRAAGLAGFVTPTKVVLISELWTPDNDLLTAAMKLKRKPIVDKHLRRSPSDAVRASAPSATPARGATEAARGSGAACGGGAELLLRCLDVTLAKEPGGSARRVLASTTTRARVRRHLLGRRSDRTCDRHVATSSGGSSASSSSLTALAQAPLATERTLRAPRVARRCRRVARNEMVIVYNLQYYLMFEGSSARASSSPSGSRRRATLGAHHRGARPASSIALDADLDARTRTRRCTRLKDLFDSAAARPPARLLPVSPARSP